MWSETQRDEADGSASVSRLWYASHGGLCWSFSSTVSVSLCSDNISCSFLINYVNAVQWRIQSIQEVQLAVNRFALKKSKFTFVLSMQGQSRDNSWSYMGGYGCECPDSWSMTLPDSGERSRISWCGFYSWLWIRVPHSEVQVSMQFLCLEGFLCCGAWFFSSLYTVTLENETQDHCCHSSLYCYIFEFISCWLFFYFARTPCSLLWDCWEFFHRI